MSFAWEYSQREEWCHAERARSHAAGRTRFHSSSSATVTLVMRPPCSKQKRAHSSRLASVSTQTATSRSTEVAERSKRRSLMKMRICTPPVSSWISW
eukprot:595546-Rhodomonas_salina.2